MKTTYQSSSNQPFRRLVRAVSPQGYAWCHQSLVTGKDLAQGVAESKEIPHEVRSKANELRGQAFGYVDWPE